MADAPIAPAVPQAGASARLAATRRWGEPPFSDLRACPSCAGLPRVRLDGDRPDTRWLVECPRCGASVREAPRAGLEGVVRLWNAGPSPRGR